MDTVEIRSNARKLLFEDAGLITMRPSDVPTYVGAGAADVGITGKDVLMEQAERDVYELLDLGYGRCRMVLATVAGEDLAAEAQRRLGVMRIATKYPRAAALLRVHRPPGRDRRGQGLGGAGAARRPGRGHRRSHGHRRHAEQNGLVVREEIAPCTARLIANPVAHKLKATAIDDVLERLR